MGTLFKGGVLLEAHQAALGDLLVEGEQIVGSAPDIPAAGHTVVNCAGLYVMPGGVDVHTHLDMPLAGTASNDDFESGGRAAAFGGTTSLLDFASQPRGGTLAAGLALWRRKAERAVIDYGFHMTITDARDDALAEIPAMRAAGVTSLKVLMAYKGRIMVDDTALFRTLRAARQHDMLVLVHCENGDVEYELRHELLAAGKTDPVYHAASRPPEIEGEATNRAIMMAGLTGCPLYVVHVTCAQSAAALRQGRALGYPVMGETCVQYFHLTVAEHLAQPDFQGAKYVCSPPVRSARDHAALWDAVRDETLQVVSTDHCPFWLAGGSGPWREWAAAHDDNHWPDYEAQDAAYRRPGKELGRGDFTQMPNGLPGIEDRLRVMWHSGVNSGRITPQRFVALMSTNPARIFGLYPRKGTLLPGADADIVLWDPAQARTISAASHHMRVDYNCYEGLAVRGGPAQVYLRGAKIVDGDRWLGERGAGRYLARSAPPLLL